MAPRDVPKPTPKVQRMVGKTNQTKGRASPASVKKTMSSIKKATEKIPLKLTNTISEPRQRTATVPKVATPKPKENKSVPLPSSTSKSAKKASWKRRPKPAHSGVPVPEKMKKLLQQQFKDLDSSL
ncbi:uncharacterized protein LOC114247385 [Bombyx mandarina]|uniref:Uncharacterized protein LOC114247385 n=1 Tax=Bombyx mandarina TaxID=7092 RepID=A0A6J2K3B6_BOMMA|nr:uncharacterized protein LOC114247385 [Bombyx mandarina]